MKRAGTSRGFWSLVGLSVVTLGIYAIWHWFRVIKEADRTPRAGRLPR